MQNLVIYILSLITAFADMYVIHVLCQKNISILKKTLCLVILSFLFFFSILFVNSSIRPFFTMTLLICVSIIIYKNSFVNSFINSVFVLILSALGEIIYTFLVYIFKGNIDIVSFTETTKGILTCNLLITLIEMILVNRKITKKIYEKLISYVDNIRKYKFLFFIILFFILIIILFNAVYENYYNNKLILYSVVVLIFVLYMVINTLIIFVFGKYNNILNKYSLSLENIDVYEDMINKYRIMNHENKNELLLIRNMSKNKKIQRYIDELINNNEEDNKLIMNRIKRVPSVQIRALLYTKMLKMEKNNLNCSLVIGRKVSSKLFLNMNNKEIVDICNILNVLLDNAIDACVNSKERNIIIEFNNYENIEICISNSYSGTIDVNQIYNIGYTTKGKGHGYGLPLVKKIINSNNYIDINTQKINDYFVQTVIIKKSID